MTSKIKSKNIHIDQKEIESLKNLINAGKIADAENRTRKLLTQKPDSKILMNILGISLINQIPITPKLIVIQVTFMLGKEKLMNR